MRLRAYIAKWRSPRRLAPVLGILIAGAVVLMWFGPSDRVQPLDAQRRSGRVPTAPPEIRFRWVLEGNPRMSIRQVEEDHYAISFADDKVNFFVFQVEGAAGRRLRFTFEGIPAEHWAAIRPVCGYGDDLSDPALFEADEKGRVRWQYMTDMQRVSDSAIAYVHTFRQDSAFVALRVPYTLSYHHRWLETLPKQDGVEIITVGKSREGRPLTLIKIGRGDEQADWENPCILIHGREHGDEPDSSWVVQGAVRFLLSDSRQARDLRNRFTFLVIPILDVDATANGLHRYMIRTFNTIEPTPDSLTWATWFEQWADAGKRLDVGLTLHNPEPRDYPHLMCMATESKHGRLELSLALHAAILEQFQDPYVAKPTSGVGWMGFRLVGWTGYYFGPLPMLYEVNSASPARRLTLLETRDMGRRLVLGITNYLDSSSGQELLAWNTQLREERARRIAAGMSDGETPFRRARSLKWGVIEKMMQARVATNDE